MGDPGSNQSAAHPKEPAGRGHNADAARKAILEAAEAVFAEHGFDGARIDVIAAQSGYNKSLIFSYYGDKLNLYAAVIRRADDMTRTIQEPMLARLLREDLNDPSKLKEMLRSFIGQYFDFMVANPNFMRILNWELAEGWQTYKQILTERDFQDLEDFGPLMEQIAKGGLLHSQFNPMAQLMIAIFVNHTYLGILPFFKLFLPDYDAQSAQGLAQAREFIVEFITHGLIADPREKRT